MTAQIERERKNGKNVTEAERCGVCKEIWAQSYMDKDKAEKREDRLNYMQGINSTKDANMFEDMILIKK